MKLKWTKALIRAQKNYLGKGEKENNRNTGGTTSAKTMGRCG